MALKDKLQEKEKQQVQEKGELQQLQQLYQEMILRLRATEGYLSTFLKENMNKEMMIEQELKEIKQTSQDVQREMELTSMTLLSKLENDIVTHKQYTNETLAEMKTAIRVLQSDMKKNQEFLSKEFQVNNQAIKDELEKINNNLGSKFDRLSATAKAELSEVEKNSKTMISNAKLGVAFNGWLDWVKYGAGAAVFMVPMFFLFKWFFGLFGINLG
jgi:VIT1/CCC1 family predicted Fe2+/Mn2+ transporter